MRRALRHLPDPVARRLAAFDRRRRGYAFLRGLLLPLGTYLVLALVAMHLDRFLFLDAPVRLTITRLTHAVAALVAAGVLVAGLLRRRSVQDLAYEMECRFPIPLDERLVTLHDLLESQPANEPGSDPPTGAQADLMRQLRDETVALCECVRAPGRFVHDPVLRRRLTGCGCLMIGWLALLALPNYQFSLMIERWWFPERNLPKPSFMSLIVMPEAPVIGRGDELVVQVRVSGELPRVLRGLMRRLGADPDRCRLAMAPGEVSRLPAGADDRAMSRVQRRMYVTALSDVREPFSYRVRCGDAQTGILYADVVTQPSVVQAAVIVTPPDYTGMADQTHTDLREPVPAFAGSRVVLRFTADQPLRDCRLIDSQRGQTLAELTPAAQDGVYEYAFDMRAAVAMDIVLVNQRGFANLDQPRLSMTPREDQPPAVRIEQPTAEVAAVPGEWIPIQVTLSDDLGLSEAVIQYQINPELDPEAAFHEIPLPVETGARQLAIATGFDLDLAGAVPGDEILVQVRARDSGRNDGRSAPVMIRVTAFTGGENERRRLVALRAISRTLAAVSNAPGSVERVFAPDAWQQAVDELAAEQIVLDPTPSVAALLDAIEREHHFTDTAADKDDLRWFRGVVAVLLRTPMPDGAATPDQRLDALADLAERRLPATLHYRMGRNLARRAMGLKQEVGSLAGMLYELETAMAATHARQRERAESLARTTADAALRSGDLERPYAILWQARETLQRLQQTADRLEAEIDAMMAANAAFDEIEQREGELTRTREALEQARRMIVDTEQEVKTAVAEWAQARARDAGSEALEPAWIDALATAAWGWRARHPDSEPDETLNAGLTPLLERLAAPAADIADPGWAATDRRLGLLLAALDGVGRDLAHLARQSPLLDVEAVLTHSEQISRAGRDLRHRQLSRRRAAAEALRAPIDGWLALLINRLPDWHDQRLTAADSLHQQYRRVREPVTAAWEQHPEQLSGFDGAWLAADARLTERSPFASLRERLETLDPSAPSRWSDADTDALAREYRVNRMLALILERNAWLAAPRAAPAERRLADALMHLETASAGFDAGRQAAVERLAVVLDRPPPDGDDTEASLPPGWTDTIVPVWPRLVALAAAPPPPHDQALDDLARRAAAVALRLDPMRPPVDAEALPAFSLELDTVVGELDGLAAAIERRIQWLHLQVAYPPAEPHAARSAAAVLPVVRDMMDRYRATAVPLLAALRQQGREVPDAAGLTAMTLDLQELSRRVNALHAGLTRAAASLRSEPADGIESEPARVTRRMMETAVTLGSDSSPAAAIEALLASVPTVAAIVLDRHLDGLRVVEQALAAAAGTLEPGAVRPAKLNAVIDAATAALDRFETVLASVGPLDEDGAARAALNDIRSRLGGVRFDAQTPSADEVRRRWLVLDNARRQTASLERRARELAQRADAGIPRGWWGAPDGVWEPESRRDAEHARNRLRSQFDGARQSAALAFFDRLQPPRSTTPDAAAPEATLAWSLFAWRSMHASLGGAVMQRPTERVAERIRDPLVRWLLDEIEETRKALGRTDGLRHYQEPTAEWVESVTGYLRY